jgi:hypothetical protein
MSTSLLVTSQIARERLQICQGCKYYQTKTKSCGTLIIGNDVTEQESQDESNLITYRKKKVQLCGCRMPFKTMLAFASCPIGKWFKQISEKEMEEFVIFVKDIKAKNKLVDSDVRQYFNWLNKLTGKRQQVSFCGSCIRKSINEVISKLNITDNGSATVQAVGVENEPEQPESNPRPQIQETGEVDTRLSSDAPDQTDSSQ